MGATFVDTMQAILDAGTWTNYASQPQTNQRFVKSGARTVGPAAPRADLENEIGNPTITATGKKVYEDQRGTVVFHARNTTDRNNIKLDFYSIMENCGYPYSIEGYVPRDHRNHRRLAYRVTVLTNS
jgi:hypothetical protein